MTWTSDQHQKALQAARAGNATETQKNGLAAAAKQAGARGREAEKALQGKKP